MMFKISFVAGKGHCLPPLATVPVPILGQSSRASSYGELVPHPRGKEHGNCLNRHFMRRVKNLFLTLSAKR